MLRKLTPGLDTVPAVFLNTETNDFIITGEQPNGHVLAAITEVTPNAASLALPRQVLLAFIRANPGLVQEATMPQPLTSPDKNDDNGYVLCR